LVIEYTNFLNLHFSIIGKLEENSDFIISVF
jgi:hypothetical protein